MILNQDWSLRFHVDVNATHQASEERKKELTEEEKRRLHTTHRLSLSGEDRTSDPASVRPFSGIPPGVDVR